MNQSLAIVIGVDNLIGSILRDLLLVLITQSHDTVVASLQSPGQNLIHALEGVGNAVVDGLLLDACHNIAFLGTHGNRLGRMNQSLAIVIGVDDLIGSVRRRNLLVHDLETVKIDRRAFVTFRVLHHSDLTVGNGHGPGLVGLHIALGGLGLAEGIGIAGGDAGDGDSTLIIRSAFQGPGVSEGTTFGNGQLEFRASQRSKLVANTLDLGEVQLAQVALGRDLGELSGLGGLIAGHLVGEGSLAQGIGLTGLEPRSLSAHPDLIAQIIVLLIVRSTSLGSGFAEVPGDLIVIRGSAVGVAIELHEVIQISQNAFANFVIDRSHNGGTDGLMLNGVDDVTESSVQTVGILHGVDASHLAVFRHPLVDILLVTAAVGNLLRHTVGNTVDLHTVSLQSLADRLNGSSLSFGGVITRPINAIIVPQPPSITRGNLIQAIPLIVLVGINMEGRQAIGKKNREAVFHISLLAQQVGRQLEAGLCVGTAVSNQTIDGSFHCSRTLGHIHPSAFGVRRGRKRNNGNIAGSTGNLTSSILGKACHKGIGRKLRQLQTRLIGMIGSNVHKRMIPATVAALAAGIPGARIPRRIPHRAFPHGLPFMVSVIFAFPTGRAVCHGAGGVDDQNCGSLRVGGNRVVLGGDLQVHIQQVLRAGLLQGALDLDDPVPGLAAAGSRLQFHAVLVIVGNAASFHDLGLIRGRVVFGKCRDLHQAQAHYQGHEQAQCPLADGLSPGGSLAGIVICHDSFPP